MRFINGNGRFRFEKTKTKTVMTFAVLAFLKNIERLEYQLALYGTFSFVKRAFVWDDFPMKDGLYVIYYVPTYINIRKLVTK